MKVLAFTIPASGDKTVIVKEEKLPHFYPYFHKHEEIQITFIQKGEGTLLIGNSIYPFAANEVYILGPNMPHVFKSAPAYFSETADNIVESLTIFFNIKGKLSSFFDLPELKSVQSFFANRCSGFRVPHGAFDDISAKIISMNFLTGLDQLMQFFQLLTSLSKLENIHSLSSDTELSHFSDISGMRLNNIQQYINEHYNRNITLEEVANAAYMTPPAFCRFFKKHTRLTFVSYLNEVRINEAKKKLLDGSHDSISSVAYNCGFNSITNFNRVFKTTTGKSPSEYLNEFMSNGKHLFH